MYSGKQGNHQLLLQFQQQQQHQQQLRMQQQLQLQDIGSSSVGGSQQPQQVCRVSEFPVDSIAG